MMNAEPWSSFWSHEDAAKLVRAALSAIERSGFKVVPVEPEAGRLDAMQQACPVGRHYLRIWWKAGVSASPKQGIVELAPKL